MLLNALYLLIAKSSKVITTIGKIELQKQDTDSIQKGKWLTCKVCFTESMMQANHKNLCA